MEEILSNISLKSLKSSVTLPVHEPISFGFEEIIKAKAEADAAISAEIERRLVEMALGLGKGYERVSYIDPDRSSDKALNVTAHAEYVYDHNTAAELYEIKRRKNRR